MPALSKQPLITRLQTVAIAPQAAGDPDVNGNGFGLYLADSTAHLYETGIAMMALAASRAPGLVAEEGAANVLGRTYADILQDLVSSLRTQVSVNIRRGRTRRVEESLKI